jgi:hypothetical protein
LVTAPNNGDSSASALALNKKISYATTNLGARIILKRMLEKLLYDVY